MKRIHRNIVYTTISSTSILVSLIYTIHRFVFYCRRFSCCTDIKPIYASTIRVHIVCLVSYMEWSFNLFKRKNRTSPGVSFFGRPEATLYCYIFSRNWPMGNRTTISCSTQYLELVYDILVEIGLCSCSSHVFCLFNFILFYYKFILSV